MTTGDTVDNAMTVGWAADIASVIDCANDQRGCGQTRDFQSIGTTR